MNSRMLSIEISNQQESLRVDEDRLKRAAAAVLREAGIGDGSLSIAIVDDRTIHELNRRHLSHDYPTDVLSFRLSDEGQPLEGEVVASAETAQRAAVQFGWTPADELLLYVVHGTLHLVGYDDTSDLARSKMRAAERRHLEALGVRIPDIPDSSERASNV